MSAELFSNQPGKGIYKATPFMNTDAKASIKF